jgi:predicted phosphodiesterase
VTLAGRSLGDVILSGTRTRPGSLLAVGFASLLAATSCGPAPRTSVDSHPDSRAETAQHSAAVVRSVRVVAAGDIACAPGEPVSRTRCQQAATAALAGRLNPALVLTLGDMQYDKASLAELEGSFAKSWGKLLSRTRPTAGNHEYLTPGASGYYQYFRGRQPGPPGNYSVVAGAWRVFVVNSNCDKVSCAAQARWLRQAMAARPTRCSLVTMHHPRFSSGEHGNSLTVKPMWAAAYRHRNDIVLSGHDHDYERFRPMDPRGRVKPRRGMQEFVVGTGGRSFYRLVARKRGSAYFQSSRHGVLSLDLRPGSYSWAFHSIDGRVLDRGSRRCR